MGLYAITGSAAGAANINRGVQSTQDITPQLTLSFLSVALMIS
jgi:hypothetical protein